MTGDDLTPGERALVVGAVRAVVERDEPALRAIGAFDETDAPLLWADDYVAGGRSGPLTMPGELDLHVTRDGATAHVDVELWTEHEGRSDLTLQLVIDGHRCRFVDLHVL